LAVTHVPTIQAVDGQCPAEIGQAPGHDLGARPGARILPWCPQGEDSVLPKRFQAFRGGPTVPFRILGMSAQNAAGLILDDVID
jgi:hypothetical protein